MAKTEWINLNDGLAIYKKPNSSNWYYWIKLDSAFEKGEIRKTTKLKDQKQATKFAYRQQILIEVKISENIPVLKSKTSVKSIIEKVIIEVERRKTSTKRDYLRNLERFNDDFGDRDIKTIITQDIKDYLYKHPPQFSVCTLGQMHHLQEKILLILIGFMIKN